MIKQLLTQILVASFFVSTCLGGVTFPPTGMWTISGGTSCTGTAGYSTIGGSTGAFSNNWLVLNKITSTCTLNSGTIYAYLYQTGTTSAYITIIAADGAAGEPGTKLWSGSVSVGTDPAWISVAFSGISHTGDYYIGVWNPATTAGLFTKYDASTGIARYATVTDFLSRSSVSDLIFSTSTALRSFYAVF